MKCLDQVHTSIQYRLTVLLPNSCSEGGRSVFGWSHSHEAQSQLTPGTELIVVTQGPQLPGTTSPA